MNYQQMLQEAVTFLRQNGSTDPTEARLDGMLEGLRLARQIEDTVNRSADVIRHDIAHALLEALPPITEKNLSDILIHSGESLEDLQADYEEELFQFFQTQHPENCNRWLQKKQDQEAETRQSRTEWYQRHGKKEPEDLDEREKPPHTGLLYAMSSSGELDSAVIVEFAQTNLKARKHLLSLLEGMSE